MTRTHGPIAAICFFLLSAQVALADPPHVREVVASLSTLPPNTIVEGSLVGGGMQPPFLLDPSHALLEPEMASARALRREAMANPARVIQQLVRRVRELLPYGDYYFAPYLDLMDRYRRRGEPVPLGEYLRINGGTCRENALLMHLFLQEAGISPRYVYARIQRTSSPRPNELIEHAFNVVRLRNSEVVIDTYFHEFHGQLFSTLQSSEGASGREIFGGLGEPSGAGSRVVEVLTFPIARVPLRPLSGASCEDLVTEPYLDVADLQLLASTRTPRRFQERRTRRSGRDE